MYRVKGTAKKQRARISVESGLPSQLFTTVQSMLLLGIRFFYVLFDFLVLLVVLLTVVTFAHGILLWIC